MIKFHRILLLILGAVFLASTTGIARYAADSCTQSRMYRQLAALTENFPGDAASPGNDFLPQYQALYAQNSDLAGWIQIDGTNINYPVMQSKSSCFFCPSMTQQEILYLKKHYPDLFRRAVALEENAMPYLKTVKGLGRNYSWKDRFGEDQPC